MTDDATIEEARQCRHVGYACHVDALIDIATRRGEEIDDKRQALRDLAAINENVRKERDALAEEIKKLKEPIKCIPTESGYMCSHCGTTLRADSPDYLPPARNPR